VIEIRGEVFARKVQQRLMKSRQFRYDPAATAARAAGATVEHARDADTSTAKK
jgi:hypothetical protein